MTDALVNAGRWRLAVDPTTLLPKLPHLGRIMVIAKANGVTHERIGEAEAVVLSDGKAVISGATHDALLDLSTVCTITFDTTSVMQDKTYARLDFAGPDGVLVMSLVAMDGPDALIAALSGVAREAVEVSEKDSADKTDLAEDDLCIAPFQAALEAGRPVTIRMEKPGLTQRWHGTIEAVRPAMGFLNIMTPDFHLHLKGGTVGGWQVDGGWTYALDTLGARTGLAIGRGA